MPPPSIALPPVAVRRVLLLGPPRSGTTWLGGVLSRAPGVDYVFEPDNEKASLLAWRYKKDVARFPLLRPGQRADDYQRLWTLAFAAPVAAFLSRSWLTRALMQSSPAQAVLERSIVGKELRLVGEGRAALGAGAARPPAAADGRVRVVKSVHGVLAGEWIAAAAAVDRVILVLRHPCGVLASWRRLRMPDALRRATLLPAAALVSGGEPPPVPASGLGAMAYQLAVFYRHLIDAAQRQPSWTLLWHEALCRNPEDEFAAVAERLGLAAEGVLAGVREYNREGVGYKPFRLASDEIGKWRKDFTLVEAEEIAAVFDAFGLWPLAAQD